MIILRHPRDPTVGKRILKVDFSGFDSSEKFSASLLQGLEHLLKVCWLIRPNSVFPQTQTFAAKLGQESCSICSVVHPLRWHTMSSACLVKLSFSCASATAKAQSVPYPISHVHQKVLQPSIKVSQIPLPGLSPATVLVCASWKED